MAAELTVVYGKRRVASVAFHCELCSFERPAKPHEFTLWPAPGEHGWDLYLLRCPECDWVNLVGVDMLPDHERGARESQALAAADR